MFNISNSSSKKWPLWLQLAITLFLSLVIVNLITAPLARHLESDFEFKQVEANSRSSFSLLAATIIDAVITEDIPLLETVASRSLEQESNMVGLTIKNENNELLVKHIRKNDTVKSNIHSYEYNIEFEGELFGIINIEWDITAVKNEIDRHVFDVQLLISTMLVLLSILTVLLINFLSIRPIHRINKYLISLSENKKTIPLSLPLFASSEMALLAKSANDLSEMMQQRTKREHELISTREELMIAHDQALSASRAKSGFLATMSHEIRTPMNAILGILGLLKDTSLNKDQTKLVHTGRESGELLLTIINDILDFSKMEADKLQLEQSGFNLHHLITNTVELLRHQADSKNLSLVLILEDHLPTYAKGDADRLRQILINLINNAIKFTERGNITIRAKNVENNNEYYSFHCSISDTGIGIDKKLQDSLFEEFSMADQSYTRKHEGTGLGLAICKHLVSLMSGSISCNSIPNEGSTFSFNIQLEHAQAGECENKLDSDAPIELPHKDLRILLAEDNPANQMVIKNILKYADLQVDIVANGREAITAVRNLPYDIVLMDISMPEMDGMTATKKIRQLSNERKNIPIIALTAHALTDEKKSFLDSGMNDYLSKPIDRNSVLRCISKWTNTSQNNTIINTKLETEENLASISEQYDYVNTKVIQQLVADTTPEIIPELLTLYISDSKKRLIKIEQAITDKDLKILEFETHTLGSSSAAHGNEKLYRLSRKIERLCQETKTEQALHDAKEIGNIAKESFRLLENYVDENF